MVEEYTAGVKKVSLPIGSEIQGLFGRADEHRKLIEEALQVKLMARDGSLTIIGLEAQVAIAEQVISQLLAILKQEGAISIQQVKLALRLFAEQQEEEFRRIQSDIIEVSPKKRPVRPKSPGQRRYIEAIRKYDIVLSIGPAGTGKCIAGSSLVFTTQGLLPIETIVTGTMPGSYSRINLEVSGLGGVRRASYFYDGGTSPTKRIRTRLGFAIEVTPEHPLLQLTAEGGIVWRRADELKPGDYIAIQRGQNLFGNQTRINFRYRRNGWQDHAKPVNIDQLDEDLAYFMGILTGDGCLTSKNRVILSSADEQVLACFYRTAARLGLHVFKNGGGRKYDHIIASAQLYQLLLHLGMSDGRAADKRVPSSILRAPREIVAAFLRGLFDADGTVNQRNGYPTLSSVSERLIDEVQVILLNFDILASKRRRWTIYRGERRASYQLEMTGADADRFYAEIGFGLLRKQKLQQEKRRNTNGDVIPYVHELVQAAVEAVTLPRAVHKRLDDYKTGRRWPSYEKLGEIIGILQGHTPANASLIRLEELHGRHLFWAEIIEIEDGEAHVYDLTVPGSHSFCANGFINHNTYLAMAMAVNALLKRQVSRIILTRPAVEAGEKLGYLPGTLYEKINPYLRPLYDALYDMIEADRANRLIEQGTIEIAPLAFMRGRTLNDAFIILDEAQNTTSEQMKMFLTRLGFGSKAVITGDITQVDLPAGKISGLIEVRQILKDIQGIKFVHLSEEDVVRHELVSAIIRAYESYQGGSPGAEDQRERRS